MKAPRLYTDKNGRTLCTSHKTTGAPQFHTPGCHACEEARARGIRRPDVTSVTKKQRRSAGLQLTQRAFVDWEKRRRVIAVLNKAHPQSEPIREAGI